MDVLQKVKIAIKKGNDSTIDTLLFISKIESLRQNNKDTKLFDSAVLMIKDFYKSKYKAPYSKEAKSLYGYIGKEIDQHFYNLHEIDLDNHELLTDKIIKRMKQIKNSSCSFNYKFNSLILLYEYLKELNPLENNSEANTILGKMIFKKAIINLTLLLFISYPFWLPNVVSSFIRTFKGIPKQPIYYSLIMEVTSLVVFGTAFLYLYFKEIFKKLMSFILITGLIYTSIVIPNYINDITTDISKYPEETVTFQSIFQLPNDKNIKRAIIKRDNHEEETLLFDSGLELESNKTYNIKYNKTKIIVSAKENK